MTMSSPKRYDPRLLDPTALLERRCAVSRNPKKIDPQDDSFPLWKGVSIFSPSGVFPEKEMKRQPRSPCSQCGGPVRTRTIKQEFEREGTRVSVSGIRALVCTKCGEVYFVPGGAQALVEAANGLFALARQNRQSKGKLAAGIS
jgi:YgiT-type zinc finger domain-containing protein